MDRHPSSCTHSPRLSVMTGLTMVWAPVSSSRSYTKNRFWTPTCGAASPRPGASYITCTISSARRTSLASISVTSDAFDLRTGSPKIRIWWAIAPPGYRRVPPYPRCVSAGHYFAERPDVVSSRRNVTLTLPDLAMTLVTDRGVFGADRVDPGTR